MNNSKYLNGRHLSNLTDKFTLNLQKCYNSVYLGVAGAPLFLVGRFDKNSIFLKFQLSRTLGTTSAFQLKIRKNSKNRRFYPKIVNKINSLC